MARRYLLIRLLSEQPVSGEQFSCAVTETIKKVFGDVGFAHINPRLIRFNTNKSEATLACARDYANELQAAVAMTTHISGKLVAPLTLRMSGTIRGLRERA